MEVCGSLLLGLSPGYEMLKNVFHNCAAEKILELLDRLFKSYDKLPLALVDEPVAHPLALSVHKMCAGTVCYLNFSKIIRH